MDKEHVVCVCVCIHIYIYTHIHATECYLAIKKNEIMPFATIWMDLDIIILSKVRKTNTVSLI